MKKIFLAVLLLTGISLAQNEAYLQQVNGTVSTAAITQEGGNNMITGQGLGSVDDVYGTPHTAAYQFAGGGTNEFFALQGDASVEHLMITDQVAGTYNYFSARQITPVRDVLDNTQNAGTFNYVYSDQIGTNGRNLVKNIQSSLSSSNELTIDQNHAAAGARNLASLYQTGNGSNFADIRQHGAGNELINAARTFNAYDPADPVGGFNNGARMDAGSYNILYVDQVGESNSTGLNMTADGFNHAVIEQYGSDGFEAAAVQDGSDNSLHIYQANSGAKTAGLVQIGPGNNVGIIYQQ